MLKLMLIQRNGVTTHKIIDEATHFGDFHNMVCFENFGKENVSDESLGTVHVPSTDTTYTMLNVYGADRFNDLTPES